MCLFIGNQQALDKYRYLVGQKVNKWTILDLIYDGRQPEAICECECGTVKRVRILNIVLGLSKDCGCGRKKMLSQKYTKNLVGKRFGKLTAVKLLDESNKFKRRQYLCVCDCGNKLIVPSSSLINGHTMSCGCITSQNNMRIAQYLNKLGIKYKPEYQIVVDDNFYRFDFYLPDYNLFIEYDGEHHYMPINFSGKGEEEAIANLEKTKKHDKIKNEYCSSNNKQLLRIPYWEKDNIETIISNHLQRLNDGASA